MKPAAPDVRVKTPAPDRRAPRHSEDQIALDFAAMVTADVRYVAVWNRWLTWSSSHWQEDQTLATLSRIRQIVRTRAKSIERQGRESDLRLARNLASARTVAAVERLARSDETLSTRPELWDAHPWLMATPGGTLDLQTGRLQAARPEDYITRCAGVTPSAGAEAPLWSEFLSFVTQGDAAFISYLQRVCGYCLTGLTTEQAFFFLHGPGGNGKSVFLNVLMHIAGSYGLPAAMETFIDTGRSEHPTDLAMLRGARLVTAAETEQGRVWAEAKIKQLTGGDLVQARFMRQDYFSYRPEFKLLIAGNSRPSLRTADDAIRRRFNLLPFQARVDTADPGLTGKLKAEAPAIFRWMIDGCRDWQTQGLDRPDVIRVATDDYLLDQDAFRRWFGDCCRPAPEAKTAFEQLYASWKKWAQIHEEPGASRKAFSQMLSDRGYQRQRMSGGKGAFLGIALLAQAGGP